MIFKKFLSAGLYFLSSLFYTLDGLLMLPFFPFQYTSRLQYRFRTPLRKIAEWLDTRMIDLLFSIR